VPRAEKYRSSHHQLLHVDAADMRNLKAARAAKSAETPDRPRRSLVCDHVRKGEDLQAARKRRLTMSGMSAGASGRAIEWLQGREPHHVTRTAALRTGGRSCQPATPMERGTLSHAS
jgi:hypothetical protein